MCFFSLFYVYFFANLALFQKMCYTIFKSRIKTAISVCKERGVYCMVDPILYAEEQHEVRTLRRCAGFVGVALLLMLMCQTALALCFAAPLQWAEGNMTASLTARLIYYALYISFYCATLLSPTAIAALIFRRSPATTGTVHRIGGLNALLLILFGLAVCILANYLVAYWLEFAKLFGVKPYEGDYNNDSGILSLCLNLITYAIVPGVVEELVFRGWFLGALRPFGERRALVLSALIFGLAHGNLTQLPFAFILGLLFGFIFLRTGRLWPCMIIHAANNGMSVALSWAQQNTALSEGAALSLQVAVMTAVAFVGTVAGLLLYPGSSANPLTRPLRVHRQVAPKGVRTKWLWLSPLPAALLIMAVETVLLEVLR